MLAIEKINGTMSKANLEAEKHERDAEVQRLRGEMRTIHGFLEPHWEREQRAASTGNAQTIGPRSVFEQLAAAPLDKLIQILGAAKAEVERRSK